MKRSTKFSVMSTLVLFVLVMFVKTSRKQHPPETDAQISAKRYWDHIQDLRERRDTCLKSAQWKALEAGVEDRYGKDASKLVAIEQCGGVIQEYEAASKPLTYSKQHPDTSKLTPEEARKKELLDAYDPTGAFH